MSTSLINVTVQLHGVFRQYASGDSITLSLPVNSNLSQLKHAVALTIEKAHPDSDVLGLLNDSMLAWAH